ncbi:NADH:ubiquinone reductase (Na(+)-transporting) subunit D [uncultured Ilyobacter sp.]|uniref:NADH:ubiquinone reductase (Na(+)-transporting) subunit D n=1 Tax=uncultured Ilyobacter sp. TaxID=544433 RepID=UPI0029C8D0DF|nr:NADH:ubiquinone reductase (Na(+)-transporting) subunit D [uncultured Ilyobacter sp.]
MNTVKDLAKENIWSNNPVFVQILGICSTLAVTNNLTNTFIMTVSVIFVTAFSNLSVSILKNYMPRKVRMIVQTLIIAFFVIIVDIMLRAYLPDISRSLGPYVGLIITNCIIMGRAEAFAQSNRPLISFWDGITSGLGYMWVLMVVAFFRELLGFGTLFGMQILNNGFTPWTIMVMAPSAFFILGILIWVVKTTMMRQDEKKETPVKQPN